MKWLSLTASDLVHEFSFAQSLLNLFIPCVSLFCAAKYPRGRCFIRPSGTEDVVRVYAEASRQQAADDLASSVAKLTDQFLGSH